MNVYLIGYRGTGKSVLARILAKRMGWESADADQWIEDRAEVSIAQIFEKQGEATFRDMETEVVRDLAALDRTVVALGGGAVLRETNRAALRNGRVVWLQASADTIERRVSGDPTTAGRRPNLTLRGGREEICRLLEFRQPLYAKAADHCVATDDRTPEQVADEVLHWLTATSEGDDA